MGGGPDDLNRLVELVDHEVGGDATAINHAHDVADRVVAVQCADTGGRGVGPGVPDVCRLSPGALAQVRSTVRS